MLMKNGTFFKPELCDSLISVKETIYKNNDKLDDDHNIVQNIKNKRDSVKKTIEIEEFMKSYKDEHSRSPSVEEIYDNLEDRINKHYIDKFVENLNIKINK